MCTVCEKVLVKFIFVGDKKKTSGGVEKQGRVD